MRTLILSDLHLGNGRVFEAFEGGAVLPAFVERMTQEPTRLIVNGDALDFLMNDDPLSLNVATAVRQAHDIVAAPASAAALRAIGGALLRGGEVIFRIGNHDVELMLPEVQAVVRSALGAPAAGAQLFFEPGEQPRLIEVHGVRVLVTHGEHTDPWNRVDYRQLVEPLERFPRSAGTQLVKKLMNPLVSDYDLRFINLLKPDFQGAVLAALAVAPDAVKVVFQSATLNILWQLFQAPPQPFDAGVDAGTGADLGLRERVVEDLTHEEQEVLARRLMQTVPLSSQGDEPVLRHAQAKLVRGALRFYARFLRAVASESGAAYFDLTPSESEWAMAKELAVAHRARVVVVGHTHAARWGQEHDLLYANTGTWIGLMRLPSPDASEDEWLALLDELRDDPMLAPDSAAGQRILRRPTATLIEPHSVGARVRLLEARDGLVDLVLAEAILPR